MNRDLVPDSLYGGGRCGFVCNLAALRGGTDIEAIGLAISGDICPATAFKPGPGVDTEADAEATAAREFRRAAMSASLIRRCGSRRKHCRAISWNGAED